MRKAIDILAGAIVFVIVYLVARGPKGLTPYERGYMAGSFNSMRITGEVIRDARARGVIR